MGYNKRIYWRASNKDFLVFIFSSISEHYHGKKQKSPFAWNKKNFEQSQNIRGYLRQGPSPTLFNPCSNTKQCSNKQMISSDPTKIKQIWFDFCPSISNNLVKNEILVTIKISNDCGERTSLYESLGPSKEGEDKQMQQNLD